ncbi:MAG: PIN domain-containing protein [Gammaproteobacteria bacterium]|nr:PIN domain-containing protein [Gammaproteobacteria bacterium]
MRNIVVDTGPLIALFDGSDQFHEQAKHFLQSSSGLLHSNLAVITETVYMLDFSAQAQRDFLTWAGQALIIDRDTAHDIPRILQVLSKYADLPADFADASLVALCERLNTQLVASVDKDFSIYRSNSKKPFTNLFFS